MEKDWIKVYETNTPFQAEIIKGMLLDNGIEAVLVNKQDSNFNQMIPGMDEIYVHQTNADLANRLVKDNDAPQPAIDEEN
ncbi:putative signal transducing protein [Chitinophaga skermanii]|uniref:Putative signal transducing protein n=1 Tax=Chitinophaga skermanii TaxID=331697 RepID=A0A327QIN7_9BACT|nr:DUF2007 domain-containing protein [Chitinophaga skermanii]RAJ01577.1 putative signal transducing protein [Chitinophaga skermanii]